MKKFFYMIQFFQKEGYVMKNFLKYFGITVLSAVVILYILFLIVPLFLSGIVNSYSIQISKLIE